MNRPARPESLTGIHLASTFVRRQICFAVTGLAVLTATGCHKSADPASGLKVEYQVSPQPPRVGPVSVTFRLTDAGAQPVRGAQMVVEADMSHPGMSPVFARAKETQPGSYQAELAFGMAGDWVILLHGTLAGGEKLERQFDVRGVRSSVEPNHAEPN
jgi:YtkA-like